MMRVKILGISANTSCDKVIDIIEEFNPKHVAMMDHDSYIKIKDYCIERNLNIEVHSGLEGLNKIATLDDIEMVVTSVVGMIGLVPTINAFIRAKKDIALANKETLVSSWEKL